MKKNTILFAEDDSSFAKKYAEYFEENGFLVVVSNDGEDALRLYHERAPDIAVLDIKLKNPKHNGFWIAKQIRIINKDIPILFLTAIGDEETALKGFEVGGFDFIRKGVGNKELLARVNRSLQHHHRENKTAVQKQFITPDTFIYLINNALISYGQTETLSKTECELLQLLVWHKNEPQNRESVMKKIWCDVVNATEYMNKAVCKLRKLLSRDKRIKLIAKRRVSITLFVEEN